MTAARIVFDLDGTLIDSAPDIQGIANTLLARSGHAPISLEQTRAFIGNGVGVFVGKMRAVRDIPEAEHDGLVAGFGELYHDAVDLTRPYPAVEAVLDALAARFPLGICTNKPYLPCLRVLKHLGFDRYFGAVLGGDSLPQRKPDPAPLVATFEALGPEGACIYVGDSEVDAETARRAGVPFLLYTEGYRKSPVDALPHAAAFSDFAVLPDLVSDLLARTA